MYAARLPIGQLYFSFYLFSLRVTHAELICLPPRRPRPTSLGISSMSQRSLERPSDFLREREDERGEERAHAQREEGQPSADIWMERGLEISLAEEGGCPRDPLRVNFYPTFFRKELVTQLRSGRSLVIIPHTYLSLKQI